MIVGIMGVDGSGKSTVLAVLDKAQSVRLLERRTQTNRTNGATIDHHALPPRSAVTSSLKVLLRWIEHWFHFLLVQLPMLGNGYLVLIDSPYFVDMQIDPLKYRYGGLKRLLNWLQRMLPQTHLYFVLDLPASVAYARKQEVPFETVVSLRKAYLQFAEENDNCHVVDAKTPVEDVVAQISSIIEQHRPHS